jgi:hypothetical protein
MANVIAAFYGATVDIRNMDFKLDKENAYF